MNAPFERSFLTPLKLGEMLLHERVRTLASTSGIALPRRVPTGTQGSLALDPILLLHLLVNLRGDCRNVKSVYVLLGLRTWRRTHGSAR
jgi:hypothetical protein